MQQRAQPNIPSHKTRVLSSIRSITSTSVRLSISFINTYSFVGYAYTYIYHWEHTLPHDNDGARKDRLARIHGLGFGQSRTSSSSSGLGLYSSFISTTTPSSPLELISLFLVEPLVGSGGGECRVLRYRRHHFYYHTLSTFATPVYAYHLLTAYCIPRHTDTRYSYRIT